MAHPGRPKEFWTWWDNKDKKVMKEIVAQLPIQTASEIIGYTMKNDYENAMRTWDEFEIGFIDSLPSDVLSHFK